ncbi:glycoside hydrolase family 92 protein [Zasmidium cellare ATCC 36951]|uniref:Glycoside hydrolase family 92 protein n=1 Tax=Zasmidium cellare ATCC 36951 TaxID=1080233 RepID=A0A6A6CCY6_ZASCE|nr:glycoside hydrolase family 92 protein [Zasmidium cellare ATCC 36951]KAF2165054.1 glycoside hydrolase family 92 protein [Zasmidium cellare ATCC 36951]
MAPCLLSHSTTQRLLTLSLTMGVFLLVGSWLVVAGGFGEVFAWDWNGGGGSGWGWGWGVKNGSASASGGGSANWHDNVGVLEFVNPKIGTYGITPNGNGGMVPSVGMPFGMTRWTAQTRENFISQAPYNDLDTSIHGFQATHQPAIWMGESGQVVVNPGVGEVKALFEERAHRFGKAEERSEAYVYEVRMEAETTEAGANLTESIYSPVPGGAQPVPEVVMEGANGRDRRRWDGGVGVRSSGKAEEEEDEFSILPVHDVQKAVSKNEITVAMTASSHVGHMRFDFDDSRDPYVLIQATRKNWTGHIEIDPSRREISGSNNQRQDYLLGPLKAPGFSGYFVSRFSEPFESFGVANGGELKKGAKTGKGEELSAYVTFSNARRVEMRTGVSFVSVEQARKNLDIEAPQSLSFDQAVENLKQAWLEKLGRVTIEGYNQTDADHDPRTIWYTGLFHALQYPSDFSEPTSKNPNSPRTFYSGYTDSVHVSPDVYYQSWSIWDTFRAEHSLLTLFAPERVNGMMRSLVQIYEWAGRLPMWANVVETNIMIGTHVDAVIANALARGFKSFDVGKAWEGVRKNAYVPPINDTELLYYDREGETPDEVRAGLTTYLEKGYVANDRWSESGSRTLDYAFDDHAAAVVAEHAGDNATAQELYNRSMNYDKIYNHDTGFMEAKNDNGTWAGSEQGWAEGDDWIYTFNVMHDPLGLANLMGGKDKMKAKLDEYFQGGHNDHSNEPSHHAPYLYSVIGYPASTQNLTREIAYANYNATSAGLSGNEDLGQMSAWYVFSALGFYPVNPAGDEYVVGSPWFEKVVLRFPKGVATGGVGGEEHTLTIEAPGAVEKPYVKGLSVDGREVRSPVLRHGEIVGSARIVFEMSGTPSSWGE